MMTDIVDGAIKALTKPRVGLVEVACLVATSHLIGHGGVVTAMSCATAAIFVLTWIVAEVRGSRTR